MRSRVRTRPTGPLDGDLARRSGSWRGVYQASVLSVLCASILGSARVSRRSVVSDMRVSVLSGGDDPNYAVPLAASLADRGIQVEFVGNDAMAAAVALKHRNIKYLNLRGDQDPSAPSHAKAAR